MPLSNKIFLSLDSSFSIYNQNYKQSYHSKSMGAYSETLIKHILPAIFFCKYGSFNNQLVKEAFLQHVKEIKQNIEHKKTFYDIRNMFLNVNDSNFQGKIDSKMFSCKPLRILDICFGLGYNAMLGLEYFKKCEIYSPEKDDLLKDLCNFPHNISSSKNIINSLINNKVYINNTQKLYFLHGDAIFYINKFPNGFFDIVFQDAFSSKYNQELWDIDYFKQLYRITAKNCLITTYAKANSIINAANLAAFKSIKYEFGSLFYKQN